MSELAQILCWTLIALIAVQGAMAFRYVWALLRFRRGKGNAAYCPKAAVLLCMRGRDHRMDETLRALFQQDYPEFDIRIVVDSVADPAWEMVQAILAETGAKNVSVEALTHRRTTCSRKISGLLQSISKLDDSHRVVLFLDSDARPHATWMRELVAPLADPKVGVASGNRWYMPEELSWGGLACYAWNAAAVVQMYLYRITWGGSLAINRTVFEETGLLQRWANAFGDDTSLCHLLIEEGYDVEYVPSVTMVNRGAYDMSGLLNFVERQLLMLREENPWWGAVVAHGLGTSAFVGASALLGLSAMLTHDWIAAKWAALGCGSYLVGCWLYLAMMELAIRPIIAHRGEKTRWLSLAGVAKLIVAVPLAQAVHLVGLLSAIFARTHNWRNVVYRFGSSPRVSVIADRAA
jgi:glycosyltransferase involved in cell wall biosynthesis